MTQLIRSGVAPVCGGVKLLPSKTIPKGVSLQLGEGWTSKGGGVYVFSVPPGGAFKPLNILGLQIGSQYRILFSASADTGFGTMYFRPGSLGNDLAIDTEGYYDFTFTADNQNGDVRFLHTDITGVSNVYIGLVKLYEFS